MTSIFLEPAHTRLVTIAAHVDHGKTTLADNLLEYNGIISERLAGTLRYLDSDPEEQRRGITMHSSAIGLSHQYKVAPGNKQGQDESGPRIIHLVDSPGHTDFSWEVSSALTACDACLLVVDVVEGMGPRTHQVFREAMTNQLVPVLVVNKMDRLCTELCLTPTEAYMRTRLLLESVNAASAAMINSLHQHEGDEKNNDEEKRKLLDEILANQATLWTFDPSKGNVVFCSALFGWGFTAASLARALFRQKLVPIKPALLRPYIFGDYKVKGEKVLKWKLSPSNTDDVPIFAEYGLKPLWDMYEGVATAANSAGLGSTLFADARGHSDGNSSSQHQSRSGSKIKADTPGMDLVLDALQVGATGEPSALVTTKDEINTVLTRTGANAEDAVLRCLLRRFRPLAPSILDMVCEYCPSPRESSSSVRSKFLSLQIPPVAATHESDPAINDADDSDFQKIQQSVRNCDTSPDAPCVAYVCKFFSSDRKNIRDATLFDASDNNAPKTLILGLTRVLSGSLRTGQEYYLLGPKYVPNSDTPQKRSIKLYLLMGSSFVRVDEVPAGHLCAVLNLEDAQMKIITLCDRIKGAMPLQIQQKRIRPLVKVNLEADNSADTDELDRGLLKLSLADAAVEVTISARGERILACLGELHLEQSLLDLKRVYCSREIAWRTSDPIVDFGETTDWFSHEFDYKLFFDNDKFPQPRQATIPPFNEEEGLSGSSHGRARSVLTKRSGALSLRVVPLATNICKALKQQRLVEGSDEEVINLGKALGIDGVDSPQKILDTLISCLCTLGSNGNALIESPNIKSGITVFGVESGNGEIYMPQESKLDVQALSENDNSEEQDDQKHLAHAGFGKDEFTALRLCIRDGPDAKLDFQRRADLDMAALSNWNKMKGSAVAGFQLALRSGPICEEPVRNVLVVLEGFEIALSPGSSETSPQPAKPLSSGIIVSALRSGIRCALLTRPARLMEGYLRLTLNSSLAGLGNLYSVLSKRRGKVEEDSMVDGTDLLAVTALIPQAEAFGLAPELFAKTSGEVTAPEMIFSHWQRLDVDPFWIPTTEEEREDYGELQVAGDSSTGMDNTAIRYIRKVRERKGLKVDSSRTVVAAEKQRTLKR